MTTDKTTYISIALDERETELLLDAKTKTGIKRNADLIRFLISDFAKEENEKN